MRSIVRVLSRTIAPTIDLSHRQRPAPCLSLSLSLSCEYPQTSHVKKLACQNLRNNVLEIPRTRRRASSFHLLIPLTVRFSIAIDTCVHVHVYTHIYTHTQHRFSLSFSPDARVSRSAVCFARRRSPPAGSWISPCFAIAGGPVLAASFSSGISNSGR